MTSIHIGDCRDVLPTLPDNSVHMVMTSPPYFGQRDYKVDEYLEDGDIAIGLEKTIDEYVDKLVGIFREVRRVMRDDATLWLNMGDGYAGGGKAGKDGKAYGGLEATSGATWGPPTGKLEGLKPKDLIGMPWRVAFALQADGWWLRSPIVWAKCLSGGTKLYVKSQKGIMPMIVKDMHRLKDETTELWDGNKWTRVVGTRKQKRKGNEIEIVLRSGERIGCTPTHRWPTDRGLLTSADLKVGDVLKRCALPDNQDAGQDALPASWVGWFVGIYLAEGSRDSLDTIQIACHREEKVRFERLKRIAAQYEGTCRWHQYGDGYAATICMDGRILNAIIDTYISGSTSHNKHLTRAAWHRNNHFLNSLLLGYLEGDGSYDDENNRWRLHFTRNYYLEEDLRCICARLGYQLRLNLAMASFNGRLYPSFRGEIRLSKRTHPNAKADTEIMKIQKSRGRWFYDISVEDEPHTFCLASGVCSKNSNPMPESVTDRPTKSYEMLFLMTKAAKYYYDQEAVREEAKYGYRDMPNGDFRSHCEKRQAGTTKGTNPDSGRNLRDVWTIATAPYPAAHFATFPPDLCIRPIKAGTSEKGCCPECGAPWVRVVENKYESYDGAQRQLCKPEHGYGGYMNSQGTNLRKISSTTGWRPSCECICGIGDFGKDDAITQSYPEPVPCTVLDPFSGEGTVGLVADRLGRNAILIELKEEYARRSAERIRNDNPMFADVRACPPRRVKG